MQQPLKILFVSSEVAPFAKTGGLADVSAALPKVLKDMDHDVRIVMPKYGSINERRYTLREVIRLKEISVSVGGKVVHANVKSSFLPDSKVQAYFVGSNEYFNRPGFYVDPETNQDYPDNAERFSFFSRSALEILKKLHWQPDIIHCNDWQTALIPYFIKKLYKENSFFVGTKTLLTIHNVAFQGIFDQKALPLVYVTKDEFTSNCAFHFWGKVNFLKAGILYADLLNTVSKTYAKEIQSCDEFGFGLQTVIKKRSRYLFGILNGIDDQHWDPETDKFIPVQYSKSDLSGKMDNKRALVESQGLVFQPEVPVIGMVSRLTDQKGLDIVSKVLDDILNLDVQMVVLGVGEKKYHERLQKATTKYPKKLAVNFCFDNELAHLIEAGADMFLMPSHYEPCGLTQLYSLKYGTIPIVFSTGGLADTVKHFSPDTPRGYGFVFNEYTAENLIKTIESAIDVFQDKETWKKIMNRAMKLDFSWHKAAEKYVDLYYRLKT